MRVRHIPEAKEALQKSKIVVNDPITMKGNWKQLFNKEKLEIEIGCGKGGYIAQMIEKHMDKAFVAIEKNTSIAFLALKKLELIKADNFKLVNFDAANIQEIFAENEVDTI